MMLFFRHALLMAKRHTSYGDVMMPLTPDTLLIRLIMLSLELLTSML